MATSYPFPFPSRWMRALRMRCSVRPLNVVAKHLVRVEPCAINALRFEPSSASGLFPSMKCIIAIMQDYDCDGLLRAVTAAGLGATRIASTGGFLRTGNTTVVMGVEDDRMAECLSILERSCRSRVEVQVDVESPEYVEWFPAGVHEVTIGGAVVFIAQVARFVRIPAAP